MPTRYEVVIVGGGVIGSAVAYFLGACEELRGRVAVVEKDPSYQRCSTARSVGGIRQQFSTPENIAIGRFGAHFVKHAERYLAVDGETPALDFREAGYLFLASEAGVATLEGNHAHQREHGADVAILRREGLRSRFPWLNVDDIAAGSMALSGAGWLDPYALLQAFRRKARHLGVAYLADEVTGLALEGGRVEEVRLASGDRLGCAWLVNAAGPRAAEIAAMAGAPLAVRPRKRQVFVFACREGPRDAPLVIDPSGMYFRPEGEHFLCGISPPESEDPDCLDLELDYAPFEARLWPLLAHRVPAFEAIKLVRAWAGHYAYNTLDQNAVVGPHPGLGNLIFANGFSGHGLQQSPAVGRAVAELIAHGAYRTIDLTRFGYERLAENRPLKELNVV